MTMREIHSSADQVADAVLALINSRPQTPRREEIAAIFAKVLPSAEVGVPKRHAEWAALSAEVGAADAKSRALSDATNDLLTKEVQAAEDEAWPIYERLSDCEQRILAEPVHASADLMLLAEASSLDEEAGSSRFPGNRRTPMSKNPDNSLHKNGVCYWDVKASDDWGDDCLVGEEYARMYLERMRHGDGRPELWWIVRDMIVAGRCTVVECGFIQRVFASIAPRS
jgi:hypothetical protein